MFRTSLLLGLLLSTTLHAAPPDRPLPPKDAAKAMTLPTGFKASLFAGEPDVVQPIAFTFDDRGRLWVVECMSYPHWTDKPEGNDRVIILEDTDGDGVFDKKTVFLDNGRNLTSIELGFGGVWLCSAPNLLFIPMKDGEDKPSGPPQVLLDGWDYKTIKHNIYNGLTWGPDGWLYGCHGITTPSHVGKPGTPEKERTFVSCGVWRYHPTRKVFEVVANGTTNPWGLDFDDYGEMFITNCVIAHLWHVVPGAHFERMYGQDPNPFTYSLMKSCADHLHWAGGSWTESRGNKPEHSDAGGGHAHVGCMVYLGDNWPDEYRNNVFMCNLHGSRVNRDILERRGSGYVAKHGKDFLFANDPWFRGLAIKYGPDGGVYVSDWTDTGECHNYEVADKTNGRIFKVTYGTPKPWKGDISKLSDAELVKLQTHKNDWFVQHARRVLQERAAAGTLAKETGTLLLRGFGEARSVSEQLRLMWAMHAAGDKFDLNAWVNHAEFYSWDPAVHICAIRLALETGGSLSIGLNDILVHDDIKPAVLLTIASSLPRLQPESRWRIAERLGRKSVVARDANLSLMLWYGVEPLIPLDPERAVKLLRETEVPLVRENVARRLATLPGVKEPLAPLIALLSNPDNTHLQREVLTALQQTLVGRRSVAMPIGWERAYAVLSVSQVAEVPERATALAVVFDDPKALSSLRTTILDAKADRGSRERALQHLVFKGKPDVVPMLHDLLTDDVIRGAAVRGLAAFDDPKTPELLIKHYAAFPPAVRTDAIATLASRPAYVNAMLDAIEKGTIPRADVSSFVARQIIGMKKPELTAKLTKVWGDVRPPAKDKAALITKFKKELNADAMKSADRARGRLVYTKSCGACHRLFDDGGDVGPDITGSQRTSLDYVLENVLDPSAVVVREYRMTVVMLKNGRVLNGIVKQETEQAITLRTEKETIVVPRNEIDMQEVSKVSMMPDGLFDKLTKEEVRDLVAYLLGPTQVPLPKP